MTTIHALEIQSPLLGDAHLSYFSTVAREEFKRAIFEELTEIKKLNTTGTAKNKCNLDQLNFDTLPPELKKYLEFD